MRHRHRHALRHRYGRASGRDPLEGTPELALFRKWRKTGALAAKGNRKAYANLDRLQYELQDMSPLGHSLVWGHEGRNRGV